ncbi:MAG: hypothetical protein WCN99_06505 [bacterium]
MEPNDLDAQLKRALSRLAENTSVRQPPLHDLFARGRKQQRRSRLVLALSPVAAILLFLAVTAFPVFGGGENLYQSYADSQLVRAAGSWNTPTSDPTALAQRLQVNLSEVEGLLEQGCENSEVALIEVMAKYAGVDFQKVLALRTQGYGWGKIANLLGVNWHEVRQSLENPPDEPDFSPSALPSQEPTSSVPNATPSTNQTPSSDNIGEDEQEQERERKQEQERKRGQQGKSPEDEVSLKESTGKPV